MYISYMDATADSSAPSSGFAAGDIRGLKFFKPMHELMNPLRAEPVHPNRKLRYEHYVALLLLYSFSPAMKSLRDIQRASDIESVAKRLGIRRASLGSLSAASHDFDPEPLKKIFAELARKTALQNAVPRPEGLPDDIVSYLAQDGTLFDALAKMLWAHWIGAHDKAIKVHLQYDIFGGVPVDAQLTDGNGSEIDALKNTLQAHCMYIVDRGYMEYLLYQMILNAKSHVLARLRGNFVHEVLETRELSAAAIAAGVESDQIVWIGSEKTGTRMPQKMRLIKLHIVNPPGRGLKPRAPRVSRKNKSVRVSETEYDVYLLTDRMDIPAESIAQLYKYRWQIEIFFRWLKQTLDCRHLLAHSENGLQIQIYTALIASLLVVLWTGKKPNKVSLFYINMYFAGLCSIEELQANLEKLKAAK